MEQAFTGSQQRLQLVLRRHEAKNHATQSVLIRLNHAQSIRLVVLPSPAFAKICSSRPSRCRPLPPCCPCCFALGRLADVSVSLVMRLRPRGAPANKRIGRPAVLRCAPDAYITALSPAPPSKATTGRDHIPAEQHLSGMRNTRSRAGTGFRSYLGKTRSWCDSNVTLSPAENGL